MLLRGDSSLYKLIILFVFDKMEAPLSENTVLDMCCSANNWISYIDCQPIINNLKDIGWISDIGSTQGEPLYSITPDGRVCLANFFVKIPASLREEISLFIRNNKIKYRNVVKPAREKTEETGNTAVAIELDDGRIITGKMGSLLGASAGVLLNALKALGNIDDSIELISPTLIEPIQDLKINHLGSVNKRLHADEILIALSVCAGTNPLAKQAMAQLGKLKNCELHSTVILPHQDENVFKKLGLRLSYEPHRQREIIYTK